MSKFTYYKHEKLKNLENTHRKLRKKCHAVAKNKSATEDIRAKYSISLRPTAIAGLNECDRQTDRQTDHATAIVVAQAGADDDE